MIILCLVNIANIAKTFLKTVNESDFFVLSFILKMESSQTSPVPPEPSAEVLTNEVIIEEQRAPTFQEKLSYQREELKLRLDSIFLKFKPYVLYRWIAVTLLAALFITRMLVTKKFYAVGYVAGMYIINSLILFVSPKLDPEEYGETLPSGLSDSNRPFIRKLPEFDFWKTLFLTTLISNILALFPIFDIPVYGPLLFLYLLLVFIVSFQSRIVHMIKHHYLPFNIGKQTYKKEEK